MEIQSGNGVEVARAVSATSGFVSRSASGPRVETPDDPAAPREDQQAAKRIERFDIPLDNLKRMFEKPAAADTEGTAVHASPSKRATSGGPTQADPSTDPTMAALKGLQKASCHNVSRHMAPEARGAAIASRKSMCNFSGIISRVQPLYKPDSHAVDEQRRAAGNTSCSTYEVDPQSCSQHIV
ncbi:hypothetical protein EYF80_028269 [Liparis tanakae]|uniref:Uncharacterized protein n=1 Tax=Liparis tanakae TaxID=230148 RepID=A0A4Z2H9H8_9TELE|nr:hypothetical protein EYF80_028269 [Liparis tanakae]